jgi:hypothetical protein
METELLVLFAGRNGGSNGWKAEIERIVSQINGLISQ